MPINLDLIENERILLIQITGDWKTADIAPAKEKTRHLFEQAQGTLYALVDLRQAAVNLPLLTASKQEIAGEPLHNSGQIAVVGVSRMMRMLGEPILRLAGSGDDIAFFNTLEEAKAYLRRLISEEKRP